MIDLTNKDLKIVQDILKLHMPAKTKIWVFGSRVVKGKAKLYSDLDLAVDFGRELTLEELVFLKRDFENSLLPYKVDIVDLHAIDPVFLQIVNQHKVLLLSC